MTRQKRSGKFVLKYFFAACIVFLSFTASNAQEGKEPDAVINREMLETPEKTENSKPAELKPQQNSGEILPKDFFKTPENIRKSDPENFGAKASLHALNKITAHTSSLEIPKGSEISFGTLVIKIEQCWRSSPDELPEAATLLKITELKPGEGRQQIFYGWMFSSSPGISALEHSVYDISVVSCTD